jgi:hypothetical protein
VRAPTRRYWLSAILAGVALGAIVSRSLEAAAEYPTMPRVTWTSTSTLSNKTLSSPIITGILTATGTAVWTQAVAAALTPSVTLQNTTAATVGAQKYSPTLSWIGQGWGTTAPASASVGAGLTAVPIQGLTPTASLGISFTDTAGSAVLTRHGSLAPYFAGLSLADASATPSVLNLLGTTGFTLLDGNGKGVSTLNTTSVVIQGTTVFGPSADATTALGVNGAGFKRLTLHGTVPVAGDFALSGGWGASASVGTIVAGSDDNHWRVTITSAGAGQAANPTITYTYKDLTWTGAPFCSAKLEAVSTAADLPTVMTTVPTATTDVITFNGTPVAARTYTVQHSCTGR